MDFRIGDRVVFTTNENLRHSGVIVARGYGPPDCASSHVFVRYDDNNRTNATAVKSLTLESTIQADQEA